MKRTITGAGRTFVEYLNVVRVGAACKLLIQTGSSINNICYFPGFNNLSNFNRQFFAAKHMSPGEYRRLYNRQFDRSAVPPGGGGR